MAHDFNYDPKNLVVTTGEPVSIHLISNDIAGVGLALSLPLGQIAFNGPLMPMKDPIVRPNVASPPLFQVS